MLKKNKNDLKLKIASGLTLAWTIYLLLEFICSLVNGWVTNSIIFGSFILLMTINIYGIKARKYPYNIISLIISMFMFESK
jgi:hypothetical protein